jgi:putative colanic acid biosynthesis acetyltransferase WcaF
MTTAEDVRRNWQSRRWTRREQLGRVLWALALPLFRLSPRPLWGWRRMLLRLFGAKVGANAHIHPNVRIAIPWNLSMGPYASIGDGAILYALGPITVGAHATVSQGAHLCAGTHDYRQPELPLIKAPITIDDSAWVCADAFIGPGVTVGTYAIVGARAVAMRDVAPRTIVAGNPCRVIKERPPFDRA